MDVEMVSASGTEYIAGSEEPMGGYLQISSEDDDKTNSENSKDNSSNYTNNDGNGSDSNKTEGSGVIYDCSCSGFGILIETRSMTHQRAQQNWKTIGNK